MLRGALLLAEVAFWHWFVVLVLLLSGSMSRLVFGLGWALFTSFAVLRLDRSQRPAHGLVAYLFLTRGALLASQIPVAWIAWKLAPLAVATSLAASGWMIWRRPGGLSPVRGLTLFIAVLFTVDAAWYLRAGLATECRSVVESEVVRPLLLFEAVSALGREDPRFEADCRTARTVEVDSASGDLLLACGTDPQRQQLDALIRVDPAAPGERQVLRDYSAYQAVSLPEHDRVWVSIFGRSLVRGLDRDSFETVREVPLPVPYLVRDDPGADRLLVGSGGQDYGCLVALDPVTGDVIARSRRPPQLDLGETTCSPADIGLLPALDRIVVTNFVGPLSLSVFRYSDLELVGARHRGVPTRDVVVARSGDRAWVAVPFLARIEELDAESLAPSRPPEASLMRVIPGLGILDPPGAKGIPEARRIRSEFGAASLAQTEEGELVLGNYMLGTLRRLELATGRLGVPVSVGRLVRDLTYDRARDRLYAVSACGLFEVPTAALGRGFADD